ncbi:hypothetical protein BOQ62_19260 [Chryseobacterium sp. CH21]|uniref:alpha/beta hydrolase n=1 Tax=Chryseobacterium sp. CH21 TaxID=713556 RepID=UPI00100BE103|nr:alpha/beta hydrolase [Chryseobacterium sp. CH21]RXM38067.1 hypothetical protein BOQ62_19260 [Chryseobacterium sp. CH21]
MQKKIILTLIVFLLWSCNNDDLNGPTKEIAIDQKVFYRDLRIGAFVNGLVVEEKAINTVLKKIMKNGSNDLEIPGMVDTKKTYSKGNWVYEFTQLAKENENLANKLILENADKMKISQAYALSSAYYTIAGFPYVRNVRFKSSSFQIQESIDKARINFQKAIETETGLRTAYEFIGPAGEKINATLLLPLNSKGQCPVIISTMGSDQIQSMFYGIYQKYLKNSQFALLTFDLPGYQPGEFLEPQKTNKYHDIVIDKIIQTNGLNGLINKNAIGVWSKSFGGNAATLALYSRGSKIKAACIECGAVITPFYGDPTTYPKMTAEGVQERFAKNSLSDLHKILKNISLKSTFQPNSLSMPLLIIGNPLDYINPEKDMVIQQASSTKGQLIKVDNPPSETSGHCPPQDLSFPEVLKFFSKHLKP